MVAQHQIFTGCHLDCFICIDRDSSIILQMFIENSFIFTITLLNVFFYFLIRTSVCQTKLPVRVSLCAYRINQFLQIWYRCTVQRNHNTDQRILFKMYMALSAKSLSVRFMTVKPFFIIFFVLSVFVFAEKTSPETFCFLFILLFPAKSLYINLICFGCRITAEMKYDPVSRNFEKCRGNTETNLLIPVIVIQMTSFYNVRPAASRDLAVEKFCIFFMNGYFNFTSLICCPSLNLKHQSIENFYTVNMKFNQLIFDQFIQFITGMLPDYGLFFSVQQKKFQYVILLAKFQNLRNRNCKSRKKALCLHFQRLCHIRSVIPFHFRYIDHFISVTDQLKTTFLLIRMHIPAYKAQHMSVSVIISFFINAETKFVHKYSPISF